LGVVVQAYNLRKWRQEDCCVKPAQAKDKKTLSEKQTKSKRAAGMVQVVERLPSKFKVLSSVHSATIINDDNNNNIKYCDFTSL
jgi:DNA phosphorothioation-dependent restriction protein DptG